MKNKNRLNFNQILNFIHLQLVFLIYSFVGIFAKLASGHNFLELKFYLYYCAELVMLFVYALLWQKIIKNFDVTFAYANKGVVVVWMLIWSMIIFNESIEYNNILGALIIIFGIGVLALDEH